MDTAARSAQPLHLQPDLDAGSAEPGHEYAGRRPSSLDCPLRSRGHKDWLPSPAQRLYLDAFDRLLRDRDEIAAARVDHYFGAMIRERGVADRRRGGRDIDAMLLGIARGVLRPIADELAA